MLQRIGTNVSRHAWRYLAIGLVAFIAAGAVGVGAFTKLKDAGFDDPSSASTQVSNTIDKKFGGTYNLVVLAKAPSGSTVSTPAMAAAGRQLTAKLTAEPQVRSVASYWTTGISSLASESKDSALVVANFSGTDKQYKARADGLARDLTAAAGPLQIQVGGAEEVNRQIGTHVATDLAKAETIAIPVTLLLLVVAFGSLIAASLPVAVGGMAVLGTLAVLSLLASVTDVSVYALNLATATGLGLGIDYALLMVNRYREELDQGLDSSAAVIKTVQTAGRTVLVSAGTIMAALAALLVFPMYFLRSFAYVGIAVTVIAGLSAVVLLPALLIVLGPRVNSLAIPMPWRRAGAAGSAAEHGRWYRIAKTVTRRPVLTAAPVLIVLSLVAAPFLHVAFASPDDRVLHKTVAVREVGDTIRSDYAGNDAGALQVVLTSADPVMKDPALMTAVDSYARTLSTWPTVERVDAVTGSYLDGKQNPQSITAGARLATGNATLVNVIPSVDPQSPAAQQLVHQVRALDPPLATSALVGGRPAELVDSKAAIAHGLPAVIALMALTTFVLLFLFSGSVILPLKALVLNFISVSAVFGVLVWIFQQGHLSGVLGFTPTPLDTSMPMLMFCISFGLSMDYEVFLLGRIKEFHDAGYSTNEAVALGLDKVGRIVTTAALLLAVSFLVFTTAETTFLQLFGIGCGIAVLLDATLIRGILVPAFMRLAGEANWWAPAPLRKVYLRLRLAEG
jgi:RND superfamily putative drug exporter